jgi:hypothetical protein
MPKFLPLWPGGSELPAFSSEIQRYQSTGLETAAHANIR